MRASRAGTRPPPARGSGPSRSSHTSPPCARAAAPTPAPTPEYKVPTIGFVSHYDTTPDFTGANVKPQIVKNYDGGDIVLNKKHTQQQENLLFIQIDFENMVQEICNVLYEQQLQSLIVEGGQNTLQQFINQDLWDEARIFKGNISFEKGLKAPEIDGIFVEEQKIKNDSLKIIRNKKWTPILP